MKRPECRQTGDCDGHDCWCQIEWFCEHAGLARVFSGDDDYGDPYCYCLPFVVRERFAEPHERGLRGMVEYVGVYPVMRLCQYKAMREAMRSAGYGILSTRIKDGRARTIEICKRRRADTRATDPAGAGRSIRVGQRVVDGAIRDLGQV